jgi:hypothetical protein
VLEKQEIVSICMFTETALQGPGFFITHRAEMADL